MTFKQVIFTKKLSSLLMHSKFFPALSSIRFSISDLMLRYFWIYLHSSTCSHSIIISALQCLLKINFLFVVYFSLPFQKSSVHSVKIYVWVFSLIPSIIMSVFMAILCIFCFCFLFSFVFLSLLLLQLALQQSFKSGMVIPLKIFYCSGLFYLSSTF